MVLKLSYKTSSNVPVEVEGITPDRLRGLSQAEIERLDIYQGNVKVALAEFFDVSGDVSDETIQWHGELSGVHWIGAKMTAGCMHVMGNAGRHVGSEMSGGEILVEGNVSDWLAGEMHGGRIRVRGSAGHLVGAAYRGSARGMTRGEILIDGSAGNEIGHTMRRGLIAVGGSVGDLVGFNMLAGTVLMLGACGIRHGAGMRRGTLAFLGQTPPPMLPSFRQACRYRPDVMPLLLRYLRRRDFPVTDALLQADYHLFHGDLIEGGRGEVLIRAEQGAV
jgi:formylmethanofuran dehydrogenase subunit C